MRFLWRSGRRCRRSRPDAASTTRPPRASLRRRPSRCRRPRRGVLELDVRSRDAADVAAGRGVGDPRRRGGLGPRRATMFGGGRSCRRAVFGPVLERRRELRRAVDVEVVVAVETASRCGPGTAGERRQDPVGGVRDQDGVVVRHERAVAREEVEQVRHLLEIGRDVRAVAPVVRVVELEIDDVLDLAVLLVPSWHGPAALARRSSA